MITPLWGDKVSEKETSVSYLVAVIIPAIGARHNHHPVLATILRIIHTNGKSTSTQHQAEKHGRGPDHSAPSAPQYQLPKARKENAELVIKGRGLPEITSQQLSQRADCLEQRNVLSITVKTEGNRETLGAAVTHWWGAKGSPVRCARNQPILRST